MSDIFTLAKKMERAARNGTGFNVTADEMRLLLAGGGYELVQSIKTKELQAKWRGAESTQSETTGSTSDVTARRPMSGRSRPTSPEADRSFIAALRLGA